MTKNWKDLMGQFGKHLLDSIDGWDDFYSGRSNPVTAALKDPDFINKYGSLPGFNRMAVCRIAVLCQMKVYDRQGGPEGDGRPKGQRRHWYSYFKGEIAQPFAMLLGDYQVNDQGIKEMNDGDWVGRLSMVYAELVDSKEVTYKDLWVEDASRMFSQQWQGLFEGLNLMICVEKDSLFADFKAAAEAIGAKALYSGKGKSSKAAIEKVLRETFYWSEHNNPFDNNPLVVLHISDYDYDGEAVIGPTFAEQARRYTDNIIEARIGVNPKHVQNVRGDLRDAWYTIKISNKSYQTWADTMAIFQFVCGNCGTALIGQGKDGHTCPDCGTDIQVDDDATPHGFEVESLRTRDYYTLIADAFMRVIPFDETVQHLREECTADTSAAADGVVKEVLDNNESYQSLLKEFDRLNEIKAEFERRAKSELEDVAEGHESDWEDEQDDPEPDDLRQHMTTNAGRSWGNIWRPFDRSIRTSKMVEWLHDAHQDTIDELVSETIDW